MRLRTGKILKYIRRFLLLSVFLAILFLIFDLFIFPIPTEKLYRDNSYFIYDRAGNMLNCFASSDHFWRKPVRLEDISPRLMESVIAAEDRWFRYHPGVNPISLIAAAITNLKAGEIVRGGSTITMQIARMMEPKERTIKNKLVEIIRAFQLELHFSKDELLEIYFNLVPYGGNIEGVGAATQFYFGKSPGAVTTSEAAILAIIPSSPNAYRPDINPSECLLKRNRILAYLNERNVIDSARYLGALEEEIPSGRFRRPFIAPHFCQYMVTRYPECAEIYSTIKLQTQILCERLAAGYHQSLVEKGIYNLSVVVLDNNTGELLAMVGSPDFNDDLHHGQINGAMAPRSPGSALKPFVYALGFEEGIITPAAKVEDIPVNYAGYSPENYNQEYSGLVSVSEALIQSLNVPAVNITSRVGLKKFYDLLISGGLTSLNKKYFEYGLPLVLGACEVSLLDLCNLYASIARGGIYLPVRMLRDVDNGKAREILSEEACYLVSNILANLQRPELSSSWEFARDLPTVAWKTGTSYGRKDAWTIGYNPDYTAGVWVGNFSGEGSPWLVGAEVAAPLMFDIFHEIADGCEPKWFSVPDRIGSRQVCAVSGMPPNQLCPSACQDLYIKGMTGGALCTVHKEIMVDRQTGYKLCRACAHGKEVDIQVIEQWPTKLSNWLLSQGLARPLPEHNPLCHGILADDAPIILSPEGDAVYEIRQSAPLEFQKIAFKATANLECSKIHWFLDGILYGTCDAGAQIFYLPERGKHELMCLDELGRSATIGFEIK